MAKTGKSKSGPKKAKTVISGVIKSKPVIYRSAPAPKIVRVQAPANVKKLLEQERELAKAKAALREERMKAGEAVRAERAKARFARTQAEYQMGREGGYALPASRTVVLPATDRSKKFVTLTEKTSRKRKFKTKEQRASYVNSLGLVSVASGGIAVATYGAMDYAGLSEAVPVQKFLGISLAGWLGALSLIMARFVFSAPMVKDGAYGVGLGLISYEITRQVGTRFADWSQLGANWSGAINEFEQSVSSDGPLMFGNRQFNSISAQRRALLRQQQQLNAQQAQINADAKFMQELAAAQAQAA